MRTDDKTKRIYLPTTTINEGTRVREDYGNLKELAESIRENGLIHPIVVDLTYRLVAGGRRLRACRDILKLNEVPCTFIEVADEATLRLLEAEENVKRKDQTWQEKVKSIKLVHTHQVLQTALQAKTWTLEMTGGLVGYSKANISYTLLVAGYLESGDKEIIKCENFSEALRVLIKRKEDEVNAALAKSTLPGGGARTQDITDLLSKGGQGTDFFVSAPVGLASRPETPELPTDLVADEVVVPLSLMMHKGDCIEWMRKQEPESFDHIITDAPYAIDMDNIQQDGGGMNVDSTREEHDVQENKTLLRDYIREAKRSVKDRGFIVTWCDISQWDYLLSLAKEFGLSAQRWPVVWHKTHQCQNMAATYNFTKNFEIALVLRKGNATLISPQSSAIWQGTFALNEKESYGHPFAKPAKLWQWLYGSIAQRGQSVLDCFAGSGSSTVAAIGVGLRPISIELKDDHYNRAVVNVTNAYRALHPKVKFI